MICKKVLTLALFFFIGSAAHASSRVNSTEMSQYLDSVSQANPDIAWEACEFETVDAQLSEGESAVAVTSEDGGSVQYVKLNCSNESVAKVAARGNGGPFKWLKCLFGRKDFRANLDCKHREARRCRNGCPANRR